MASRKPWGRPSAFFFDTPHDRERLAGKACQQHVVHGYPCQRLVILCVLPDITGEDVFLILGKVFPVGLCRVFVPLAGENTFAANALETDPETTNAGEEVNKAEPDRLFRQPVAFGHLPEHIESKRRRRAFAVFVTVGGADGSPGDARSLLKGKSGLLPEPRELCLAVLMRHSRISAVSIFATLAQRDSANKPFVPSLFEF